MFRGQRWNELGLAAALLLIVIAQLIWLFDPLQIGGQLFVIDLLDYLVYACLLPLLLWILGAISSVGRRDGHSTAQQSMDEHRGGQSDAHVAEQRASKRLGKQRIHLLLDAMRVAVALCCLTAGTLFIIDLRYVPFIAGCLLVAIVCIVAGQLLAERHVYQRILRRTKVKIGVMVGLLIVLVTPTHYMVTYPGLTINMHRYATVAYEGEAAGIHGQSERQGLAHGMEHDKRAAQNGQLMGVLVFERPAFLIDWLYAYLFDHYEFRKIQPTDPPLSAQLDAVRMMKHNANELGSAIAFHRAGIGAGVIYKGVRVVGTIADTPAAEQLQRGDLIVALNGQPVDSIAQFIAGMGEIQPGHTLQLAIIRSGVRTNVTIEAIAHAEEPDRAVIGMQIADETELDLPLDVQFQHYMLHEGGPSHGAILTLALIDQLTPGGVLHGNKVAGTGTIRADGSVGWIGGIKQKAFAVERAGADVFFVPAGQEEEARQGAKQLEIVPVETIDQMIEWLAAHPNVLK